jgi:hypothetical protein
LELKNGARYARSAAAAKRIDAKINAKATQWGNRPEPAGAGHAQAIQAAEEEHDACEHQPTRPASARESTIFNAVSPTTARPSAWNRCSAH